MKYHCNDCDRTVEFEDHDVVSYAVIRCPFCAPFDYVDVNDGIRLYHRHVVTDARLIRTFDTEAAQ